ncbi:hypothetical protein [Bacteroides sedimenti]|uniref:Lipoprotein n=1 Tax=Bacteroides sedimenti TaxID=2136147 RepID=A0ABN6Z0E8_9BACE
MNKKERIIILLAGLLFLSSCSLYRLVINSHDNYTFHIILLLAVVLVLIVLYRIRVWKKGREEVTEQLLNRHGMSIKDFFDSGSYVGGFPSVEDIVPSLVCRKDSDEFVFYHRHSLNSIPIEKFRISKTSITNVTLEEASNIIKLIEEHKVLLVSSFTPDFETKKRNNSYYVSVEWNDGSIIHITLFHFDGYNSLFRANDFKYKLIHHINNPSSGVSLS